jgi:hypothetical protein
MGEGILLIIRGSTSEKAEEAAFSDPRAASEGITVLQILDSDLYHYGHNDLVATRPSKSAFLHYIRDEVLTTAKEKSNALYQRAGQLGLKVKVLARETEDPASAIIEEAGKGYSAVFLPKERGSIFPLFKRNIARELNKRAFCQVLSY